MTPPNDSADSVALSLTQDEALVLFEWLHSNEGGHSFSDQSEQRVLWDLETSLERQLVVLLSPDYARFLSEARERIRDSAD